MIKDNVITDDPVEMLKPLVTSGLILEIGHLPVIYEMLNKASSTFPDGAVEISKGKQTGKGYDTTGYKYQYCVNAMNEIVGSNHWRYEIIESELVPGKWGNKDNFSCNIQLRIDIGNRMPYDATLNDCPFEVLDSKFNFGDHVAKSAGDAKKGALTNAFKKVFAMFGLGADAYTGELHKKLGLEHHDDEYQPQYESNKDKKSNWNADRDEDNTVQPPVKESKSSTGKYDPANPYGLAICHLTGESIPARQLEHCRKNGIRPTSIEKVRQYLSAGNISEIELNNEEMEAANG